MGNFYFFKWRSLRQICYLAIALTALGVSTVHAEVVVIVAANSAETELSKSQIAEIFLGKTTAFPDGTAVLPVDLPGESPTREQFYQAVAGKSAAQVKSYWARMGFTGKGTPPKEGSSPDDVKKMVTANANLIGYIEKADLDASVKILFTAE